jgi:hypothetical protein
MEDQIKIGTVLIKEGARFPEFVQIESEPCLPGWRLVKGLGEYVFGRSLHEAGWACFQTGETDATVFGIDAQQMVHRAVEAILSNPRAARFNCLEIARLTSVRSERFPGVRFLTLAVYRRYIEENLVLSSAESGRESGSSRKEFRSSQDAGLTSTNGLPEETSGRLDLAAVSDP